jgi:hypothetical protein
MSVDLARIVRELVDSGSETYEQKMTRMALKVGAIALFLIVVWKLLTR